MVTETWKEFLNIVKGEAGSRIVETWFKAVTLRQWDALSKTVYLQAPNVFVRDWIKSNYLPIIQLHLGRLLHVESPKIVFIDSDEKNNAKFLPVVRPASSATIKRSLCKSGYINRGHSFDTFVVGPSNSLACAAAHAVTEQPGRLYNPLFIYGDSGLGKTHLLHSIGNGVKIKNKKANILYQTTDRFVNEFISAIRFNKVHKFQAKYKHVDVLLIDDVQFISNKEQTQEAFFHIFNALYDAQKQLVFSSDTFPQNIDGLADRLRSRLAWGLVTDIYTPSLETKIAILKKKAEASNEQLCDEVAHFIASHSAGSVRELEGALVRVMAFSSLTGQNISFELAQKVLIRSDKENVEIPTDFNSVVKCIERHYSYNLHDLRSKNRSKELSFARQVAMFLMKKATKTSLREIGDFLGGRDHSTVVYAINKVEQYAESNEKFQHTLTKLEKELRR